jgi:FK506-binding protein 1
MGVDIVVVTPGNGIKPSKGQEVHAPAYFWCLCACVLVSQDVGSLQVTVHYTGTLLNGKKFDSSRDKNKPFKFKLGVGQVITAWDEGVAQMSVGERATLTCSPDYAYGAKDVGNGLIPANSTLIFDVELLSFQ